MNQQTQFHNVKSIPAKAEVMFLGLDVHADQITVCRQIDGATPQPAFRLKWAEVSPWMGKQLEQAKEIHSCYEAGPFGYRLHRDLNDLGVKNIVIAPQLWDERGTRVKTDSRDAREMCLRLERYVRGNRQALSEVRVPTPVQEQRRALCRQRQTLVKERCSVVLRAGSLLLSRGLRVRGLWWKPKAWDAFSQSLPAEMRALVEVWQKLAVNLDAQEKVLRKQLEQLAPAQLPLAVGALSWVSVEAEVLDWARFKNRREVASYTGLCPSEYSSGSQQHQGCINRHGNPRLRHALVECVWRLARYQPQYRLFQKFPCLLDKKAPSPRRRKAVVAVARCLAIDLWRLATQRTTAQQLGLKIKEASLPKTLPSRLMPINS